MSSSSSLAALGKKITNESTVTILKGVRSDKERLPKSYSRKVASVEVVRRRAPEGSRVREVMVEGAGFCGKGVSSVRVGVGVEVGGAFAQFRLYFVLVRVHPIGVGGGLISSLRGPTNAVRSDKGCFFAVHC